MFETIAHLLSEAFELARRGTTPGAVRRRMLRRWQRAARRESYWASRRGLRAERKVQSWGKAKDAYLVELDKLDSARAPE